MAENFTEDRRIQEIAEAYSMDAIDFARDHFKLELDWRDGSVAHIETMLSVFHDQLAKAEPSDEQIFGFAKMFGSYVGEVFRRNHGATWGLVKLGGESFPGLQASDSSGLFCPWERTRRRILNGSQDNVWDYYQALVTRDGGNGAAPTSITPMMQKKSWWDRLRGV
ncbi:hypothetical protein [Lysobacter sp. Root690]|uniref:hypothetical protein n=1 Tax=Lysobacter sp. Root690 TaxID=1736588 RepID=UPI0006F91157|nr:hypothetical protein [Lysobacter sp. Root690]KRB07984.1 hypothetical protein ASD86_09295 [Lysobacter sp. Root690]